MEVCTKLKILSLGLLVFFPFTSFAFAAKGKTDIKGTAEASPISGTAAFEDTSDGLKISVALEHVPPGKHGFHIHEKGDCGDGGKAAGGHYNPDGVSHGLLLRDGFQKAHAGDLGNVEIDANGRGKLEAVLPGLTLAGGKYNVARKSLILHEKEDDYGQPTGNAGGRIGCGVIALEE